MTESDRRAPEAAAEFGSVLRRLREQSGLNRKELALRIGRDPSTITRLESGERGVSRDLVDDLARELALSITDHFELLAAAGLLSEETAALLEEPALSQLSRLLAESAMPSRERELLLRYVELALAHAAALGYDIPAPWPRVDDGPGL